MPKTITVNIPHKATPADVRAKIRLGITDARQKYGKQLAGATETWTTDDHMEFRATTMGQTVTGRLDIDNENVRVQVYLPMMLAIFAGKIIPRIESEGRKLLGTGKAK